MADGRDKPVLSKPVIFISYSHKDEPEHPGPDEVKWRTYVVSHLQPAVKNGICEIWVDNDIEGGEDWRAAIEKKLNTCDVCILLVSRYALSSDFILDVEVKRMLERRETDGVPIYPIVLSPFATAVVPWLMAMNLRPGEGKPLSTFAIADRDTKMAEIVNELAGIADKIAETKKAAVADTPQSAGARLRSTSPASSSRSKATSGSMRKLCLAPWKSTRFIFRKPPMSAWSGATPS